MKAKEIIRRIKEIDDLSGTRFLEDMFMIAYIKGINRGYRNAISLVKQEPLTSDKEEAKEIFRSTYL